MVGQLVGHYKILEKLSEGGMGAVYRAVDTMLDREVAIKVLRPALASKSVVVERFRLEAITLAKLNHPNIATLHSFFSQGEEFFMILEFVRGETLDKVLQRRGPLSCAEAIPIFTELLDSIGHAHEFGVIHRDIKPANLMLTEKGTLKVLDFGIARLRGSARITRAGNIIGTLEYMSPEQTKGQETDARSDIYSLGMTLYEILTGSTPFDSENEFELIQKQIGEMPRSPREINPDIPEEIEAAIMKAFAKNPDERFQTAVEFREALINAGFAASSAPRVVVEPISVQPAKRTSKSDIFKPSISKEKIQEMMVDSPETPTVEVLKENLPTIIEIIETPFDQNQLPAVAAATATSSETVSESPVPSSVLRKLTWIQHHAKAGAGIFVLLVLLASSSLIFFQSEENPPEPENKKSVETNLGTEEQKPEVMTAAPDALPKPVQPAPTIAPPQQQQQPQTAAKKKSPREAEAERLRRAEKLLTGN